MADNVNQLKQQIKDLTTAKTMAEDRAVEAEQELKKFVDSSNEVITKQNQEIGELRAAVDELQQRLANASASKAAALGIDPVQLASLVLLTVPMMKDANGNPLSTKNADEGVRLVVERCLPPSIRVVRALLDELSKL